MNKILVFGAVIIVAIIAVLVFLNMSSDRTANNGDTNGMRTSTTYTDQETGVRFTYAEGDGGYVIEESRAGVATADGAQPLKTYVFLSEDAQVEREATEGLPAITLVIYQNERNLSASQWVDAYPVASNIQLLMGDADRDAVVGGANAVTYRTDGLYVAENAVVAHGGYIFHFSGSFLDESDMIRDDYEAVLDSVVFVQTDAPQNTSQTKLDVRVVCESALAYMTFADDAEAAAFVEACVAGEHPEVIERYIAEMGLDGAAI